MRFASGAQHGSLTPGASAECTLFILSGWEKALIIIQFKYKNFHFFWKWGEGVGLVLVGWLGFSLKPNISQCAHTINTVVFKSPSKIFFSPDNNSDENSGVAANLLLTIKRA